MHPDSYMPFDGNAFFQAVEGQPSNVALGYMRLIWHYWHHLHCRGYKNDLEYLRNIARIERDDWDDTCAVLFDNSDFFTMDADGFWHQKRADEEWEIAQDKYNKQIRRTKAATKARWGGRR
jgi:uncharacterized protein YdaU (DUF1376 family)